MKIHKRCHQKYKTCKGWSKNIKLWNEFNVNLLSTYKKLVYTQTVICEPHCNHEEKNYRKHSKETLKKATKAQGKREREEERDREKLQKEIGNN